jgi:hypothetical protein
MPLYPTLRLLILASLPANAAAQQVILGVLEKVPRVYADEHNSYAVRVLFKRSATGLHLTSRSSFSHQ